MKAAKFDAIVEARSNERVQKKIAAFRAAITKAFLELGIDERGYRCAIGERSAAILRLVADNENTGWPASLWDTERVKVAEELLEFLSPMEQMLRALDRLPEEEDVSPAQIKQEE